MAVRKEQRYEEMVCKGLNSTPSLKSEPSPIFKLQRTAKTRQKYVNKVCPVKRPREKTTTLLTPDPMPVHSEKEIKQTLPTSLSVFKDSNHAVVSQVPTTPFP